MRGNPKIEWILNDKSNENEWDGNVGGVRFFGIRISHEPYMYGWHPYMYGWQLICYLPGERKYMQRHEVIQHAMDMAEVIINSWLKKTGLRADGDNNGR